jgi:hypothetical protein
MLRPSLTTAAAALLCASAMAQADLSQRPKPITAPFKHAGVYHVATGTWTRGASQAILGPDIIYNNSCNSGYFTGTQSGEVLAHRSRIPTTAVNGAPTADSVFYPGSNPAHEFDERPGCDTQYEIQHFQIVYCSSRPSGLGLMSWNYSFADAYNLCGTGDMVADPLCDYAVTGLPGGTSTGAQNCWIVDIDLSLVTPACTLNADQDGTYVGPGTAEQFGYAQTPITPGITAANATGPVIAGNYTWTGGTLTGVLTPCTGADGTIWDSPVNLAEEGTGMNSNDFFRVSGPTPSVAAGCYFFGGQPHGDFYLKLFSKTCGAPNPMVQNCRPGIDAGLIACPCSNPPANGGLGCNNFQPTGPAASATLTASLVTGTSADISDDSDGTPQVILMATGENSGALTVFFAGKNPKSATGIANGAGVRCVTQNLKRVYIKNASGGGAAGGAVNAPTGSEQSITLRMIALGSQILPGETRKYYNSYRDPQAAGPCGSSSSTINLTNAGGITWGP